MQKDPRTLTDIIKLFVELIDLILPVMVGLALLSFFKGLIAFIGKSGDAKNHEEGRKLMVWGLIALFAMVSVIGILLFFRHDFGFTNPFGSGFLPLLPH